MKNIFLPQRRFDVPFHLLPNLKKSTKKSSKPAPEKQDAAYTATNLRDPENEPPQSVNEDGDAELRAERALEHQVPVTQGQEETVRDAVPASGTTPPRTIAWPSPVSEPGQFSYFHNAHDFTMNNPRMYDMRTLQIVQPEERNNPTLEWLAERVIPGAEFDSSERDPPPQCHPLTRRTLRSTILHWLLDRERAKKFLWLQGPAGVGKSALMQTIAETQYGASALGAALFLSRPNHRNDPKGVIATLAYQFATRIPLYQAYARELMIADPRLLEKGMKEQFRKFIVEPFALRGVHKGEADLSVLLDGLDECEGAEPQCKIIELISGFVLEFPTVPLVWIIASRPEPHLKTSFSNPLVKNSYFEEHVPVDSTEACQDVERYLRVELKGISARYSDAIPEGSQWPAENHFLSIASAASGLFAFAATVVRFIDDNDIGDPPSQLEYLLSFIATLGAAGDNPLALLDCLYTRILSSIPSASFSTTKLLLGYHLVEGTETSFLQVCNFLGLKQNVAYGALRKLHSVLNIPSPNKAFYTPVSWYHASFADFLRDSRRSHEFAINMDEAKTKVWWCYFRVLQQANDTNLSAPQTANITLSWSSPQRAQSERYQQDVHGDARLRWASQFLDLVDARPDYLITWQQRDDVLAQLNFRILYHGYLEYAPTATIGRFIRWLMSLSDEPSLRSRGIINSVSLLDVYLDDQLFSNNINYRAIRYNNQMNEYAKYILPFRDVIRRLRSLKQGSPSTRVIACGTATPRKCLIVKANRDGIWEEFYILPHPEHVSKGN